MVLCNGKAFISTHGIWEIHKIPNDYWRFTPNGLNELFKEFSEVIIIPNGGIILCLGQLLNLAISSLFYISILKLPIICFWTVVNVLTWHLDKLVDNKKLVINYTVILRK